MSFLYPRTISLRRPRANSSDVTGAPVVGAVGYQGVEQSTTTGNANAEDVLQTGIPCSISVQGIGKVKGLDITPSDSPGPVQYVIVTQAGSLADGAVRDRDIIVDDYGYRHQVVAFQWSSIGTTIRAIRLEA